MRKIKTLIALCAFLANIGMIQAQNKVDQPLRFKMLTYNVGHFNQGKLGGFQGTGEIAEKQLEDWRKWIGAQGADFMIVNEWNEYFDKEEKYKATEELLKPYYSNVYFGDKNEWIYNGIATNFNLINIRQVPWFGQYYAIIGDLVVGDKRIAIISSHIPWQVEWHDDAIIKLKEEMKKYEYFICLGDFNAKNKTFEEFKALGYNVASGGAQGWFTTAPGGKMAGKLDVNIDNIVTSGNIKIMKVEAPYTELNDLDHLPVLAEIIISE
ncbi:MULTISPECIES: endonuclease/exonuclease/phosphatase family protein [unclassified Myroides]|uniref:endonuclease/exonuclease/phosphatase family protein n=1 Tax=unclassified Myroides TaxID=2642485 RepID=UPI003D2F5662